ncbi:hypothetical protein GCM10029976_050680 [Kribbella albertanoniae]|uniref:RDD family protein n=1 Tax=Kribbella albertanoniae TaxID=1266829 RepID=A0A4V2XRJ2_9ACTN|nr:RDD family protein [Kribbella albertanoniae]TDC30115.1 RDD family protein [Kribbella albertanoniae]
MTTPFPPPGSNDPQWGPPQPPPYAQPANEWAPLAEWLPRVGAALVDGLVQGLPVAIGYILFLVNIFTRADLENDAPQAWAVIAFLLGMAISFGLWLWNRVFRQGNTGQSIGKSVLKIRLIDGVYNQPVGPGKALGRELLAWVFSYAPLIDVLWPLWDEKKQTLHDKVLNTYVVIDTQR